MPTLRACLTFALHLAFALALPAALLSAVPARAQEGEWRNGLSLLGTPKYQPGFAHFDYVNPDAPKGGTVRLARQGGFDNFNPVVAGVKGVARGRHRARLRDADGAALDEVSTEYGLLAEAVSYPADFSSVTYRLRPEAKWQDGAAGHAGGRRLLLRGAQGATTRRYAFYYQHVIKAEKTGEREVTFTFDQPGNRELPQIVGQLTVLPEALVGGQGPQRQAARHRPRRRWSRRSAPAPTGSRLRAGRNITYERVKDYWGARTCRRPGRHATISTRSATSISATPRCCSRPSRATSRLPGREQRQELGHRLRLPGRQGGRVIKEEFADDNIGRHAGLRLQPAPAEVPGSARARAFNLAFDFEEMNKTSSTASTQRIDSFFAGHRARRLRPAGGQGAGDPRDRQDKVPPEVFTTPYKNPVDGNPQTVRDNLREAVRLLRRPAGRSGPQARQRQAGEPLTVEILLDGPTLRARRAVLQAGARAARHRGDAAHGRRRRSSRSACATRFRHDQRRRGQSQLARQRAARLSGARPAADRPARATSPASRTRRSTR